MLRCHWKMICVKHSICILCVRHLFQITVKLFEWPLLFYGQFAFKILPYCLVENSTGKPSKLFCNKIIGDFHCILISRCCSHIFLFIKFHVFCFSPRVCISMCFRWSYFVENHGLRDAQCVIFAHHYGDAESQPQNTEIRKYDMLRYKPKV